jgi:hypothetical protein
MVLKNKNQLFFQTINVLIFLIEKKILDKIKLKKMFKMFKHPIESITIFFKIIFKNNKNRQ